MSRVDFINALDRDGAALYIDGVYVDQYETGDLAPEGESRQLDFHHRLLVSEPYGWPATLMELEPYLNREATCGLLSEEER